MRYRLFGTTADVGVISHGADMKEAFENQAAGMFSIMVDMRGVRRRLSFDVEAEAVDAEALLAAWLEELLFLSDSKGVFLKGFDILEMSGGRLAARVHGEEIDPARHVIKTPVKAVTYHGLAAGRVRGVYMTRVVYDI